MPDFRGFDAMQRRPHRASFRLAAYFAGSLLAAVSAWSAEKESRDANGLDLERVQRKWTGDLGGMVERHMIRALVVYSKTFYFLDGADQRGTSYDALHAFQEDLNRKLGKKIRRVQVIFIPVSRDELLPALTEGRGDLAVANLTITPERKKLVDFSIPVWQGVKELVVTGPGVAAIRSTDDLSGKTVLVRKSSSYYESLESLNKRLRKAGKWPTKIKLAPDQLEDEDLLEMVNAGLVPIVIVDSHKAKFWAQILKSIKVHENVAVREGGDIAWAFRKGSPKLAAAVNDFVRRHRKGTRFGNILFRRYLEDTKWVQGATSDAEFKKFERTLDIFKKYAGRYDFDWLMVAAQGYQESRLDQNVRSPVGAVGVMQVMPATGKAMDVGDIRKIDPNIHAGTKYMRTILDTYFADAKMDALNRNLFAFAAYNAGPSRIAALREEARKRGLDPDKWFGSVERVAAERIGRQTVQYVSNIYKYYVAYKLILEERAESKAARKKLHGKS
jgi:membrane-bound lytic murein transglycosylase MltF